MVFDVKHDGEVKLDSAWCGLNCGGKQLLLRRYLPQYHLRRVSLLIHIEFLEPL